MDNKEEIKKEFEIMSPNTPSNLIFKVIIIGDSGVGKTCLSERGTKGIYNNKLTNTVGFDFYSFIVKYKDNIIKLEIWDTCGQEAYRSLITNFYKNCYLAIIVYSVTSKESFQSIPEWIRQCKDNSIPNIKLILIGNKNDVDEDEREVELSEGERMKENYDFDLFMETSAKNGFNTLELFCQTAKIIYDNFEKENHVSSTIDQDLISDLKIDENTTNSRICCSK